MDTTVVLTLISAGTSAISVLFFALMREKDRQVTEKAARISTLEAKVEQLTDIVGKNTDSLEESNVNSRMMIDLLRRLDQAGGRAWTNSPPDQPPPALR